jgi:phage/plasmid-associated DNA primase
MDIPTPGFDRVCESQELSDNMRRWFFVMIGRCIYDVRELDDWQVMLFLCGAGNTGKSNILRYVIANFFQENQVGILMNNIEEKFGLGMVASNFIVLLDDIRENFHLDQSDFQNCTSGNAMACPVKNDSTRTLVWKAQFVGTGNEVPGYRDNSESFSRRMFVIPFRKKIKNPDAGLRDQLLAEVPNIIAKSNRAYRETLRKYGGKGIWNIAPKEALIAKSEITASSNYLSSFLDGGELEFGDSYEMPMETFVQCAKAHAVSHNFGQPAPMVPNFYRGPFDTHGIKVQTTIKVINGKRCNRWIQGCRLMSASQQAPAAAAAPDAAQQQQARRPVDENAADVFDEQQPLTKKPRKN